MNYNIKFLISEAESARAMAYVPYSGFYVGAALLGKSGEIYKGCNIESASYSPTNCAERTALFSAVAKGEREFIAIAVIGGMGKEKPQAYAAPCGVCRQMLYEFDDGNLDVILATDENDYKIYKLSEILPLAFTKNDLE